MNLDVLIREVTDVVLKDLAAGAMPAQSKCKEKIPAAVSNRHVHLSREHAMLLFANDQLTNIKALSQPGQYACAEQVLLAGPKGAIASVRVLGPTRGKTQIELSATDCSKLGIQAPLRQSGDISGSAAITIIGPQGAIILKEGAIIAERHIHMHPTDANRFKLIDGERVSVRTSGPRGLIFNDVLVRVSSAYKLEMHIDFDEANAAGISSNDLVEVFKF